MAIIPTRGLTNLLTGATNPNGLPLVVSEFDHTPVPASGPLRHPIGATGMDYLVWADGRVELDTHDLTAPLPVVGEVLQLQPVHWAASDGQASAAGTFVATWTRGTVPELVQIVADQEVTQGTGYFDIDVRYLMKGTNLVKEIVNAIPGVTYLPAIEKVRVDIAAASPGTRTITIRGTNFYGSALQSVFNLTVNAAEQAHVPGPPAAVRVTLGDGVAVAEWSAPEDEGGAGAAVIDYKVEKAAPGSSTKTLFGTVTGATNGRISIAQANGAAGEADYFIAARNAVGFGPTVGPIRIRTTRAPSITSQVAPTFTEANNVRTYAIKTPVVVTDAPATISYAVAINGAAVTLSGQGFTGTRGSSDKQGTITTTVTNGVEPAAVNVQAFTIPLVSGAGTTDVVFDDGSTLTFDGVFDTFRHVDGQVQLLTDTPPTILSKTPATYVDSDGRTRHGSWLKPMRANSKTPMPFDSAQGSFTASKLAAYPMALPLETPLVLGKSRSNYGGNARNGPVDTYSMVYASPVVKAAGSQSPPSVGWAGRTAMTSPSVVDYAAFAATLPTTYGQTDFPYKTLAEVQRYLRFNPVHPMVDNPTANDGYEDRFPYMWLSEGTGAAQGNFGKVLASSINNLFCHLIAPLNLVPLTVKTEICKLMDSYATQTIEPYLKNNAGIYGNGGHHQWYQAMMQLHYIMRGDDAGAANVAKKIPGNWGPGGQAFLIGQTELDRDFRPVGTPFSTLAESGDGPLQELYNSKAPSPSQLKVILEITRTGGKTYIKFGCTGPGGSGNSRGRRAEVAARQPRRPERDEGQRDAHRGACLGRQLRRGADQGRARERHRLGTSGTSSGRWRTSRPTSACRPGASCR